MHVFFSPSSDEIISRARQEYLTIYIFFDKKKHASDIGRFEAVTTRMRKKWPTMTETIHIGRVSRWMYSKKWTTTAQVYFRAETLFTPSPEPLWASAFVNSHMLWLFDWFHWHNYFSYITFTWGGLKPGPAGGLPGPAQDLPAWLQIGLKYDSGTARPLNTILIKNKFCTTKHDTSNNRTNMYNW